MSHTHGPWRSPWLPGSKQRCAGVSAGDCYVYLNVAKSDDLDETIERWKHDARLIAAARELLKACQYLSEWVEHTVPTWTAEVECGLQLAKEAIAKATGGAE